MKLSSQIGRAVNDRICSKLLHFVIFTMYDVIFHLGSSPAPEVTEPPVIITEPPPTRPPPVAVSEYYILYQSFPRCRILQGIFSTFQLT